MPLFRIFSPHYFVIILAAIIGIFFVSPVTVRAGFGVSPTVITIDDILIDTQVSKNFTLSRGEPVSDDVVRVTISGDAIENIIAEPQVVLLSEEEQTIYTVSISSKGLIPDKVYQSILTFVYTPQENDEAAMMQVYPGVQAKINFSVTTESITSFEIKEVKMPSIYEGEPLSFSYYMINDGNVPVKPSQILVNLTNRFDPDDKYTLWVNSNEFPDVAPFHAFDVRKVANLYPKVGKYTADVLVYNDDKVIFEKANLPYQVEERSFFFGEIELIVSGIVLGLIIILILLYKMVRLKVKGRR